MAAAVIASYRRQTASGWSTRTASITRSARCEAVREVRSESRNPSVPMPMSLLKLRQRTRRPRSGATSTSHRDATQDHVQTGSKKNSTSTAGPLLWQSCVSGTGPPRGRVYRGAAGRRSPPAVACWAGGRTSRTGCRTGGAARRHRSAGRRANSKDQAGLAAGCGFWGYHQIGKVGHGAVRAGRVRALPGSPTAAAELPDSLKHFPRDDLETHVNLLVYYAYLRVCCPSA